MPLDWFEISVLPSAHNENTGYNTQKPKALIERIIKASSREGDLVADFYGGSFTTAEVCKELNRNFIGCDISEKAVKIGKKRVGKNILLRADMQETLFNNEPKQLTIPRVSNSVICCPQCGNERLESTGGDWYICGDRSCDWGDKL